MNTLIFEAQRHVHKVEIVKLLRFHILSQYVDDDYISVCFLHFGYPSIVRSADGYCHKNWQST